MSHHHDHGAHGSHDSQRRLGWAILLTGSFMVAELVGGVLSGSLALLADAGHMLTDAAALALALFAAWISRRPADTRRSYGYHRVQVLAAFVNGLTLIAIVVWIAIEAVRRLFAPVSVAGSTMLVIAGLGLVVNLVVFAILHMGDRENLNIRGAALHVLGDLLGSVAAIVAAVVILLTGWTPIDPLLSLLVAALILRSAWKLTRESGHILLEGTPEGLDVDRVKRELAEQLPAVRDVHHVHAWSLTPGRHLMSLHAILEEGADQERVLVDIKTMLSDSFAVEHATIQVESWRGCVDESGR
ncbi:cation diffusion facilitator family transporter [Halomonas elongata]|uniref:Cation diffusion facilitator family transport protein (Probable substrate zinc) n=1 Tax=Halomonas elongata (strain ATCC 33173 / DSM 2581 / NBRC 15536 / NCIMB 2198 / 1H9) TaxID=768066 RepID=E1V9S0_HALED|nr:cation diffusion facilitator family transporter [Halomonas elongata]WBF19148.1 cation diffusion facilitator family transporter [Halomonas elongata]WPU48007.1 cation diffusion facilitator family transporter [Halomonas elongata DSM 2581]CBV41904.1 cation diffusion facilitator family transport protein (probable substrate zinc) [Halomonas elongata DSM 2581]